MANGLFSKEAGAAGATTPSMTGGQAAAWGAGIAGAGLLGQELGLFGGNDDAFQYNPDFSQPQSDIGALRAARDRPIEGMTQSGEAEMGMLDMDRRKALDDLRGAQAGRLSGGMSQMALSGGLSSGAAERMAGQSQQQGGMFAQQMMGDFAREGAGVRARNFAQQEQLRNKALFATPELSMGMANTQAQIGAGNAQAQAAADGSPSFLQTGLGIAGTAVGTAYGGPIGGMIGGWAGNTVGGLFS